jgi:hypothetical protein
VRTFTHAGGRQGRRGGGRGGKLIGVQEKGVGGGGGLAVGVRGQGKMAHNPPACACFAFESSVYIVTPIDTYKNTYDAVHARMRV